VFSQKHFPFVLLHNSQKKISVYERKNFRQYIRENADSTRRKFVYFLNVINSNVKWT